MAIFGVFGGMYERSRYHPSRKNWLRQCFCGIPALKKGGEFT